MDSAIPISEPPIIHCADQCVVLGPGVAAAPNKEHIMSANMVR
jgi:hypothetical protein